MEALLLLKSSVGVAGGVTAVEPQESDEGIVSDQSNEFDDKKVSKYFSTIVIINKIFISCSESRDFHDSISKRLSPLAGCMQHFATSSLIIETLPAAVQSRGQCWLAAVPRQQPRQPSPRPAGAKEATKPAGVLALSLHPPEPSSAHCKIYLHGCHCVQTLFIRF